MDLEAENWIECEIPPEADSSEEFQALKHQIDERVSLLRNTRNKLGLTQQQAADIVGVSRSFMSKLENSVEPRVSVLSRLISAAGGRMEIVAKFPDKGDLVLTSDVPVRPWPQPSRSTPVGP